MCWVDSVSYPERCFDLLAIGQLEAPLRKRVLDLDDVARSDAACRLRLLHTGERVTVVPLNRFAMILSGAIPCSTHLMTALTT